jgi:hypothetical protein
MCSRIDFSEGGSQWDSFQLTVIDKTNAPYKKIGVPTSVFLGGGNVVIHGNTK